MSTTENRTKHVVINRIDGTNPRTVISTSIFSDAPIPEGETMAAGSNTFGSGAGAAAGDSNAAG